MTDILTVRLFHVEHSMESKNLLQPEEIRQNLTSRWLGRTIHFYEKLDSTNLAAMTVAEGGAPEGTALIAEEQLQGRGRADRAWHSPAGVGIYCSVILRPNFSPARVQLLTLMAAVAVAHAITRNLNLSPGIKWPNDILVHNKKIAGILLETKSSPTQILYAVLGIGVNVNHTSDDLPSGLPAGASSLRIETGELVDREGLVCQVFAELENLYEEIRLRGSDSLLVEWRKLSITLGQGVRVLQGERVIEGRAMDVNEDGALLVKERDGSLTVVHAGDVEHLRAIR